jgi:hypothetical protein
VGAVCMVAVPVGWDEGPIYRVRPGLQYLATAYTGWAGIRTPKNTVLRTAGTSYYDDTRLHLQLCKSKTISVTNVRNV